MYKICITASKLAKCAFMLDYSLNHNKARNFCLSTIFIPHQHQYRMETNNPIFYST